MPVLGSLLCDWHKLHSTSCGNPKPLPDFFFLQILGNMSRVGGGAEGRHGCRICFNGDFLFGGFDSRHFRYTLPSTLHQPMYGIKLLSQLPLKPRVLQMVWGKGKESQQYTELVKGLFGVFKFSTRYKSYRSDFENMNKLQ